MRYFKSGSVDDAFGTGVSVYSFSDDPVFSFSADLTQLHEAAEIEKPEYDLWAQRIANPDMVTYFPGIFPGIGVVNREVYDIIQAKVQTAKRNAQRVTPRQAREWLIINDLDEPLEAGIVAIGASGKPADVKQSKLMWNWYEKANEWAYDNAQLVGAFKSIGIDRDKFFAEAKLL